MSYSKKIAVSFVEITFTECGHVVSWKEHKLVTEIEREQILCDDQRSDREKSLHVIDRKTSLFRWEYVLATLRC